MCDLKTLHQRLKQSRESSRKETRDVARQMDVSVQAIWQWEKGEAHPSVESLCKLAAIYGVPIEWLTNGDTKTSREILKTLWMVEEMRRLGMQKQKEVNRAIRLALDQAGQRNSTGSSAT